MQTSKSSDESIIVLGLFLGFVDVNKTEDLSALNHWKKKKVTQHDIEMNDEVRMTIQAEEFYLYCLFIEW